MWDVAQRNFISLTYHCSLIGGQYLRNTSSSATLTLKASILFPIRIGECQNALSSLQISGFDDFNW